MQYGAELVYPFTPMPCHISENVPAGKAKPRSLRIPADRLRGYLDAIGITLR